MDSVRADFEEWAGKEGYDLQQVPAWHTNPAIHPWIYRAGQTQQLWECWQAARASGGHNG